jgi:hypothetical protein
MSRHCSGRRGSDPRHGRGTKFKQALDCGFKTPGQGRLLLAEAEQKGFEIKAAAG